jgi:hypothetical protein
MSIGTYLYLHAVGANNHVAVPSLVREGAKRSTGSCDPRDQQLLGSHVRRVLKIKISVPQHSYLPLGQSDMFLRDRAHSYTLQIRKRGVSLKYSLARRVRTD